MKKLKNNILKKISMCILALSFVGTTIASASALSYNDIVQLKGADRYATASAIAGEMGSYDSVILVNADFNKIADGLSASGLSGVLKAPILLVHRDSIPNETQLRMDIAKRVYIIGSGNSISSNLEKKLRDQNKGAFNVKRIGGNDRFETSYNVAKEILNIKGSIGKVFITNGYKGEADAMSASAVAARDGEPVLLTNGTRIDGNSFSILKNTNSIYAVGGVNSISENVISQLGAKRISGNDRFETNKAVFNEFYKDSPVRFYIGEGYKLVDSLTGGPLAGKNNCPIILVSSYSDKSALIGANSLVSLGGVSKSILDSCVLEANK